MTKPEEHQTFPTFPRDDWYHKYYYDMRKVAWNCARCSMIPKCLSSRFWWKWKPPGY